MTEVYFLHDAWHLMLDGRLVQAEFNSKGAAEAAIDVERDRRMKRLRIDCVTAYLVEQYHKCSEELRSYHECSAEELRSWYCAGFLAAAAIRDGRWDGR